MKIRKEMEKGVEVRRRNGRQRESGEVGFECDRCGRVVDVCIE